MVDFVKLMSEHDKARNPNFLIITQNAPELYLLYKDSIDGVGKEDTWYDDNIKLDGAETEDYISRLNLVKKENKFVLAIDYPTTNKAICDFYASCNVEGYACTVSNRDLALSQPLRCV